jgi:hypothetical protein
MLFILSILIYEKMNHSVQLRIKESTKNGKFNDITNL